MGADGGTIPTRDELVKMKDKRKTMDKSVRNATFWRHDTVTSGPLVEPIVACELGRLYNRETILELMLDRSKYGEQGNVAQHIRSMKDVVALRLTPNPTYSASKQAADEAIAPFVCPVSNLEMSGFYRFAFLPCGCVFSEKALREVTVTACMTCGRPYQPDDVTVINGSKEEQEQLLNKLTAKRAAKQAAKKARKAATAHSASATTTTTTSTTISTTETDKTRAGPSSTATPSPNTSQVSKSVPKNLKRKNVITGPDIAPSATKILRTEQHSSTKQPSVLPAMDDASSSVYKSLFESEAQKRTRESQRSSLFQRGANKIV